MVAAGRHGAQLADKVPSRRARDTFGFHDERDRGPFGAGQRQAAVVLREFLNFTNDIDLPAFWQSVPEHRGSFSDEGCFAKQYISRHEKHPRTAHPRSDTSTCDSATRRTTLSAVALTVSIGGRSGKVFAAPPCQASADPIASAATCALRRSRWP